MIDLKIRPALEEDRDFIKDLSRACYHDVIINTYGEWNEDFFTDHFEKEWLKGKFQVVAQDDLKIGALWVDYNDDHLFVSELQIHPDWQNRGIGTKLMQHVFTEAVSQDLPVRLNVFKVSKANLLYQRLGFQKTGETDTHNIMQITPKEMT